jgi:choline dehydrogenase
MTNGNWSQVPFMSEEGIGDDWNPAVDWGLFTEPQINERRYHYAQGKALGGSSARNQMVSIDHASRRTRRPV